MTRLKLGPVEGVYSPDYSLRFWHDGDPSQVVRGFDHRSVVAIQTSKSMNDFSGTFTITLKDGRARHRLKEMDVVRIRLSGHDGQGMQTVMRGVLDTVRKGGSADTYASREDTVIEGRDIGKYLQTTSLFLPVWDPQGVLPTALIFGLGDAAIKVGGNTPYDIFNYLVKRFTWGSRRLAGVSGIPNSRFWLNHKVRFDKVPFQVPFLQYDEDAMSDALTRLAVTGYTEAWVDEIGRVVYRHPQWDQPAKYLLPTATLMNWDFPRTDVGAATYVEVIPAGDPGIDSAAAQALRAGRAPVPSSYLAGADSSQFNVSGEFIIDTDTKGNVTTKGRRNYWYKRQRHLGLRPQQITSPLLFDQAQAQAQAEGLLRFYGRMLKSMQVTIPGSPSVRLGENTRVYGDLDGERKDTAYYLEQVAHEYVEGDHYTTTLGGTHGRDPWDPKWGAITIPKFDPATLATGPGGVLPSGGPVTSGSLKGVDLSGWTPKKIIDTVVLPVANKILGTSYTPASVTAANNAHGPTKGGTPSDHQGPPDHAWAVDMSNGVTTKQEDELAKVLAGMFGISWSGSGIANATSGGFRFQLIYRINTLQAGNHFKHVHFGVKRL